MTPVVRFAPSPTGRLHIGNIRPALFNWLYAKRHGGRFILRFDDTDRERSTAEYAAGIVEDLTWLGLKPDLQVAQSERLALYDAAFERLKAAGRLYPCYETPDELERRRKRQIARGQPPIYDRAALKLSAEERARLEAEGRRPHWRFLLETRDVVFDDLVRGEVVVHAQTLSDPVLVRADGTYLYTFTSVVDDIDLGVTHIIRGEDHVTNTGVQIELFEALGAKPPVFAHHNLLTTTTGEGLSKRSGALSIKSLREDGVEPMAVASLATLIGTSDKVEPVESLEALTNHFDLSHVSRAPAKFDPAELLALNARLVHHLPYAAVAERLQALRIAGGAPFWEAVRGNLARVADAAEWWRVVEGPITPVIEDADFTSAAAATLPTEPFDATTWESWTAAIKAATGRKGRTLFHPLRLALTGRETGPELKALLPLIGRARAEARLRGHPA